MEVKDIISSGLLELYATGLSSLNEREQVESWIMQYPEVAAELKDIQFGLEEYAQSNAISPSIGTKDKMFAQINRVVPVKDINFDPNISGQAKSVSIKNYWKWAAAASIVLLMGSAVMNMMYYTRYDTASNKLKEMQQQLAQQQQQNKEMKTDIDVVQSPYSIPVSLKGQPTTPDAKAKIFWMSNTGDVMIDASNLPDAPAGKQYQFWAIVDGVPVDGGLIITSDKGKKFRMQKMKSFGRAEIFAISLEKEGGSPTPTVVVSMGKI